MKSILIEYKGKTMKIFAPQWAEIFVPTDMGFISYQDVKTTREGITKKLFPKNEQNYIKVIDEKSMDDK